MCLDVQPTRELKCTNRVIIYFYKIFYMFEIEYEFREADLIHFNELEFARDEEKINTLRKHRFYVPSAMLLIGAFYYFYYMNLNATLYIVLLAGMWCYLLPQVVQMDWKRKILNSYTDKEKINMFGVYTLTIDPQEPDYLIEKSPSGKHKMTFSELVRVENTKDYVHIYINLNTALVIPRETIKKGDLKQFATQVEKMIERAA